MFKKALWSNSSIHILDTCTMQNIKRRFRINAKFMTAVLLMNLWIASLTFPLKPPPKQNFRVLPPVWGSTFADGGAKTIAASLVSDFALIVRINNSKPSWFFGRDENVIWGMSDVAVPRNRWVFASYTCIKYKTGSSSSTLFWRLAHLTFIWVCVWRTIMQPSGVVGLIRPKDCIQITLNKKQILQCAGYYEY